MNQKRILRMFLIVSVATSLIAPPAQAAYTVKPKVGQCFQYSKADVSAPYAQKNPISCAKSHNAETYIVSKWPLSTPPEELPEGQGLEVASSLCMAWGPKGVLQDSYFNFWAWYTPDPSGWAKGERWLRCDAMKRSNQEEPFEYISWKGLKFKGKKNL